MDKREIVCLAVALIAVCLCAAAVLWAEGRRRKSEEQMAGRIAALSTAFVRLREENNSMKLSLDKLHAEVNELPLEQIQSIYDSEKQFQDGLSAIMAYGQQNFGWNKDGEKT